jgi:hypothetical protein
LSLVVPDCPQPVVAVFARLLALDLSVRREMRARFAEIFRRCGYRDG